jgi:serine protease
VAYAVPDYEVRAAGFIPNDPGRRADTAGDWRKLQWNFFGPASVNAPDAWEYARAAGVPGGRGVVVAVVDSGVAYERRGGFRRAPDLYAGRFVKPYDFVEDDRHPNDEESHGTHVAGTIAQKTNNGFGVTGLAYGVQIMPLRVLNADGGGRASYISRAIRYAARNGADVINMSVEFDLLQKASGIPEVISAIRYANKKGVVMVAASGNDFVNRVTYPARDPRVIAVGASTDNLCKADYSNTGKELDIVAPGGGDDAPLNDNAADAQNCDPSTRGRGIVQETFTSSFRRFGLVADQGTSFASPHVSAAAALLIATKRLGEDPTPEQIVQRLQATARDLGPAGLDPRYGAGLLDAAAALAPDTTPEQGGTAAPSGPTTTE